MSESHKYVYKFGGGIAEGESSMKSLLGGKGANLAEMSSIGLPVPPGFTISTEACKVYNEKDHEWPKGLETQVQEGIDHLENLMNARLGDPNEPLLVSVRSGAAISMPGMMDTVLNLGMNDDVVDGLAKKTNNERFAYDSYRRFIDMFGDVVMGVSHEHFEKSIEKLKKERNAELDTDLSADDLKELVDRYKAVYRQHTGYMFPQDPKEQMFFSVNAVFDSWSSSRAVKYRQINKITGLLGTAVNVQAMVFGNMGDHSATGVCFTRNPATGNKELYGEYLVNAQGEDVVAGIRTPKPISQLEENMADSYKQLNETAIHLEKHYKNMQDIEFTIQEGHLYILQTRNGKRTGPAALKIAVDMVDEGIAKEKDAIEKLVEPNHVDQLLHPQLEDSAYQQSDVLGTGLPASPGAAVGRVVFDSDEAEEWKEKGEDVILVRIETSPEDVGGMSAAKGILTSRGGMTSHAAVVARGWGKPCIAGCDEIVINYKKESFTNGTDTIKKGDYISIDGAKGVVIKGQRELHEPTFNDDYYRFMGWVDQVRKMQIRTNVDTPEDAQKAIEFGAEGIGLARTEHMFFGEGRITSMRKMILSESQEERQKALFEILPYQRGDFKGIFQAMGDRPVTVRLLDPPLHEFLPEDEESIIQVADDIGLSAKKLRNKINALKEHNPMLGHRGCRLGITYPEITIMQTRAVIEAAVELHQEGTKIIPEIMIPLVGSKAEFSNQRKVVDDTAQQVFKEKGTEIHYKVGTMIEIPRAALLAEGIGEEAEFFSFGTNDLTQLTFGFSRDDVGKFLPKYINDKLLPHDPFQTLDQKGVGQLVQMGTERGRKANPDIKVGICGEHGGDPESIDFFYKNNLNYVSCSPYRIPIARLSAAQAQLKHDGHED